MGQIMKAVQSIAVNVPDIKGRTKDGKLTIFGVKNAIESVEDVRSVMVANYMGSPIYLRDVATVEDGIDIQNFQDVGLIYRESNDIKNPFSKEIPQVTMTVAKLAGTNAVFVAKDVEEMLKEHEAEFEKDGIGYIVTRDYGERANEAVNESADPA